MRCLRYRFTKRVSVLLIPLINLSVLSAWTLDLFFRSSSGLIVDQLLHTTGERTIRLALGIFIERYCLPAGLWIVFTTFLFCLLMDGRQRQRQHDTDIEEENPLRFMRLYYVVMALTGAVALPGSFRTAVNETVQYGRLGNLTSPALAAVVYAVHPFYITVGLIIGNIVCSLWTMQCMHRSKAWD